MFGCPSKVGLSKTPILNEILKVLQKEEDLQAHLNDKPSDNIPDNVNSYSNVNSVEDNNSNDIPVPMDSEHECTRCNSIFQTNEEDKYTCDLLTKSNQFVTN